MRKVFLLALLALCLSACGAPGVGEGPAPTAAETPIVAETPSLTPVPTPTPAPAPTPVLTPTSAPAPSCSPAAAGEGGNVRFDGPGFSFSLPAELAGKVSVSPGISYFDPDGDSLSFSYAPGGREPITMFYVAAVSPRGDFFSPQNWYHDYSASISITAMGEDCVIIRIGPIGGSEIWPEDPLFDDYMETCEAAGAALAGSIAVDGPSSVPSLDSEAVSTAAEELEALGEATLTRAEAAQLAFGLLTAANKGQAYPLRYTDVDPGSEAAQAIAYLDSYGLLTLYSREGDELGGGLFRPDEPVTRAEFVTLLHRLSFQPSPVSYGDAFAPDDCGSEHWAAAYLAYAWNCLWLDYKSGLNICPDEPMTAADAAQALSVVAKYGYPTPTARGVILLQP